MLLRSRLASLCLAFAAGACASLSPHRAAEGPREITLDLTASPTRVHDQLIIAFAANGLPVAIAQPGVVEFHGARERGILGYDGIFARAVITPLDCGTRVTLFGEETHYPNPTATDGKAERIGPASRGRALEVWNKLQAIAVALRADSTRT
jgi:hypothetical protein